MSNSMLALALYATWVLLLLTAIGAWRTALTLTGRRAANQFAVDGTDISALSHRLCRAHANCYEHFPIVAGLLVAAELSDLGSITEELALPLVAARVGQSLIHIASTSVPAVIVRFGFFAVQLGIELVWAYGLLRAGLGA